MIRTLHVSPPKEYLSRHPVRMKSFLNACRVGREESRRTIPGLDKYLRLTPSTITDATKEEEDELYSPEDQPSKTLAQ